MARSLHTVILRDCWESVGISSSAPRQGWPTDAFSGSSSVPKVLYFARVDLESLSMTSSKTGRSVSKTPSLSFNRSQQEEPDMAQR